MKALLKILFKNHWKGIFLKVIIAFLIVLIAITGYKMLNSDNNEEYEMPKENIEDNPS